MTDRKFLITVEVLKQHLDDPDWRVVDCRFDLANPEKGYSEYLAGHIPGAANHYFRWNVGDDGRMQPSEALREAFTTALAGHAPSETVMYCGSGVSACHNLLAMTHAGLPGARLYVGSWSDWSSDPDRPIETGPSNPAPRTSQL